MSVEETRGEENAEMNNGTKESTKVFMSKRKFFWLTMLAYALIANFILLAIPLAEIAFTTDDPTGASQIPIALMYLAALYFSPLVTLYLLSVATLRLNALGLKGNKIALFGAIPLGLSIAAWIGSAAIFGEPSDLVVPLLLTAFFASLALSAYTLLASSKEA
jgi:uncharacterized membrane protein YhaH (DUF805 family)